MPSPLRRLRVARLLVLVCIFAAGSGPSQEPATTPEPTAPGADPTATIEARGLRKLHLVRPDLIPYPIAYEVCC